VRSPAGGIWPGFFALSVLEDAVEHGEDDVLLGFGEAAVEG